MATRQYIGARYVPRFLGTYSPTSIYDALDVVDDGMGTSYIARKTVPAGTALTDTEYWFVYGASSGAIINLQNRMGAAENAITGLQNDVTSLDGRVDDLESDKYIFIGDSYQWGYHNGTQVRSFLDWLAIMNPDMQYYHAEAGGAGFVVSGKEFLTLLQGLDGSITDKRTVKSIIVCAGYNDQIAATSAEIVTAISAFVSYAKTKYPLATVYIGYIGCTKASGTAKYGLWKSLNAYRDCASVGAVYIDNIENVVHDYKNMYDASDNSHPTEAGYHKIANYLNNWIHGGTVAPKITNINVGATVNTLIFDDKTIAFVQRQANDTIFMVNQTAFNLTVTGGSLTVTSSPIKIGTLEKVLMLGMPYHITEFQMPITVIEAGTGTVKVVGGSMSIDDVNNDINLYLQVSSMTISALFIPAFTVSLPTDVC